MCKRNKEYHPCSQREFLQDKWHRCESLMKSPVLNIHYLFNLDCIFDLYKWNTTNTTSSFLILPISFLISSFCSLNLPNFTPFFTSVKLFSFCFLNLLVLDHNNNHRHSFHPFENDHHPRIPHCLEFLLIIF